MNDTNPPEKDDFDLSALYQTGAKETPSEIMNQKILDDAKQASELRQLELLDAHRDKLSLRSWQWPLSAAAVVVIASSLTLDLYQKDELKVDVIPEISPYSELRSQPSMDFKSEESSELFAPIESEDTQLSKDTVPLSVFKDEPAMEDKKIRRPEAAAASEMRAMKQQSVETTKKPLELDTQSADSSLITKEDENQDTDSSVQHFEKEHKQKNDSIDGDISSARLKRSREDDSLKRYTSAEAWLKSIEGLIAQGELSIAKQELKLFREKYPNVKIPQRFFDAFQAEK